METTTALTLRISNDLLEKLKLFQRKMSFPSLSDVVQYFLQSFLYGEPRPSFDLSMTETGDVRISVSIQSSILEKIRSMAESYDVDVSKFVRFVLNKSV